MPHKHFRLRTLGGLTLDLPGGAEDRELATRRRKLAVLAYLAIVDKPVARATLIELFWGDQPEERARHSLSDTLSSLRRVLGSAAVSARLADVQLDSAGAGLSIDARELTQAATDGRHADVIALYAGPFLPAFAVPGSQTFDEWIEQERLRLSKLFSRSCRAMCVEYEQQNDWAALNALGLRWLEADPLSTGAQLAVLKGHAADGDPDALKTALQEFRQLEQRLSRDFGALPDRDVRELVEGWQQRLNDAGVESSSSVVPPAAVSAPAAPAPAGVFARIPRWAFGVGAVAVVAVVAVVAWSSRTENAAEPRSVIVADVENKTGDPVFDRTVSVALTAALAQSPQIRVVAPDQISRALFRMRRPIGDPILDETLAREIAQRDGVPVVVVPSVHAAGNAYELTTKTLDATSGAVLGFAAVRADNRAGVLDALDRLSRDVRRGLGETSRSIRANSVPLPLATTSSLDALKKFAEGSRAYGSNRLDDAQGFWSEATALDTSFALAYARLAMLAYRFNRPARGDSLYARAFAHAGSITERERMTMQAAAKSSRGDWAGAAAIFEAHLAKNPQDLQVLEALAYQYFRMNRGEEAAKLYERYLAIDSLDYAALTTMAAVQKSRDLQASLRAYARVRRIAPMRLTANDNVNIEYADAFVRAGHLDSAAGVIAELAAMPDDLRRARALRSQSFLNAYAGRFAEASSNLADAIVLSRQMNQGTSEVRNRLLLATLLDETTRPREAAVQLDSAYALIRRIDTEATLFFWVGKALARAGDTRRASLLLEKVEGMVRWESATGRAALEGLRGEVLLARRNPDSAFTHLRRALEADSTAVVLESAAHGAAMAGRLGEAAGMYDRLARATPTFGWEGQHLARLAPYWLGRVREQEGKPELARAAYERFLSAWPHPDSTLRSVIDARTRLEPLRRGARGG